MFTIARRTVEDACPYKTAGASHPPYGAKLPLCYQISCRKKTGEHSSPLRCHLPSRVGAGGLLFGYIITMRVHHHNAGALLYTGGGFLYIIYKVSPYLLAYIIIDRAGEKW